MQFFKTFLASLLGTILGVLLLILILVISLIGSSSQPEPYIRSNTVLTMELSGDIPSKAVEDPFEELLNPGMGARMSLLTLKSNLEKAAADENIEGVWVKTNQVLTSWANLETAYKYFEEYKESGKFLYFSSDDIGMNEKAYFLASLADSVYYPPETDFQFDGFTAQLTFYRDLLDKVGIEPEIFRVGTYKSAVEPFLQTSSSPESRRQLREILDSSSSVFVEAVMARTGRTSEEVNAMLNTPPVNRTQFAMDNGLIDVLAFEDDVEQNIKTRIGLDEDEDLSTVSFSRYARVSGSSAGLESVDTSDKIAVIYTSGMILPEIAEFGFGQPQGITAPLVQKQIDSALEDDNVKGIVVHIDSPGGAATTSDLIWNSIRKASEKIPVVASMGSVAASGGYYMAAGADTIVANPNTITGSIGIFSMLFNAEELTSEKLGIQYETLTTHEYADLYNLTDSFTPEERQVIQQNIENGYESFVARVAESRGMTRDEVDAIAQGRVYTGTAAEAVGLVDVLGDVDRAVEIAAEMAGIDTFETDVYPKSRDLFETLFAEADVKARSMLFGWLGTENNKEIRDLHTLLKHPLGQNWAFLPVRFDVY